MNHIHAVDKDMKQESNHCLVFGRDGLGVVVYYSLLFLQQDDAKSHVGYQGTLRVWVGVYTIMVHKYYTRTHTHTLY